MFFFPTRIPDAHTRRRASGRGEPPAAIALACAKGKGEHDRASRARRFVERRRMSAWSLACPPPLVTLPFCLLPPSTVVLAATPRVPVCVSALLRLGTICYRDHSLQLTVSSEFNLSTKVPPLFPDEHDVMIWVNVSIIQHVEWSGEMYLDTGNGLCLT